MTDSNEILDRVVSLWREADDLEDQAEFLQGQADNATKMAEDKDQEAEDLWKPLAAAHPEWFDALRSGEDPRP